MKPAALTLVLLLGLATFALAAPPPDRFLYLQETGPTDATGRVVPGDIRAQTARVLDKLAAALAAQGSRMERVAAVTVYLRNQADFSAMNEVYAGYWPKDPPTRTTIVVGPVEPDALVEMSLVALPPGAERRVVLPAGWAKPSSPYSYGVQSGDTLFLSGLLSRNGRDNSVVPGDMAAQTGQVLQNAAEILKASGMTMGDVVSARVYVPNAADVPTVMRVWREVFGPTMQRPSVVPAGLVAPDGLVEIALTAAKK